MHSEKRPRFPELKPGANLDAIARLATFIELNQPLFVLTGAGCSTRSGIPDYRDQSGAWKHAKPVQYQEFVQQEVTRQRYWARSMAGWPKIAAAAPNPAHRVLAELADNNLIHTLVTQNVDGLHLKAGQESVINLHGELSKVRCMSCGGIFSRNRFQQLLLRLNPGFSEHGGSIAPDGDMKIEFEDLAEFIIPECPDCGGILKPDVVLFGESVPRERVQQAFDALQSSRGLLVVGSSVALYSGFRFCRAASDGRIPMAAINMGRTRADDLFEIKAEQDCATTLTKVFEILNLTKPAI